MLNLKCNFNYIINYIKQYYILLKTVLSMDRSINYSILNNNYNKINNIKIF
jgi:hypothetical protein